MSDITMKELGDILAKRGLTIKVSATFSRLAGRVLYEAVVAKNGGRSVINGGGWIGQGFLIEEAILAALYEEKNENHEMSDANGSGS